MFDKSIMMEICDIIMNFLNEHPSAEECGSEYIYQNDMAQVDALKMAADIFDVFSERYEEIEE